MKRLCAWFMLAASAFAPLVEAGPFMRKYDAAATIDGIPLIANGATNFQINPTLATGDVKISKDGGALTNIATLPVVTPASSALVRVTFSATEMQAARIVVLFDDAAGAEWEDQIVIVETYGNASAQHEIDIDVASLDANIVSVTGSTARASNLAKSLIAMVCGTAATGTLSTTQMTTDLTETTNDHYLNRVVIFDGGNLAGQATYILDYSGTNGLITMQTLTETVVVGDTFCIY